MKQSDIKITDLLYFYFNTLAYMPRESEIFNKSKKILKTPVLPHQITEETIKNIDTNTLIYYFLTARDNLTKSTFELQKIMLDMIKTLAKSGDSDACYAMAQFYHTITMGIYYKINPTETYKHAKNNYLKNDNKVGNRIFKSNIEKNNHFLKSVIDFDNFDNLENLNPHLKFYASYLLLNEEKEYKRDILMSAANIKDIEKGILNTGNPTAQYYISQRKEFKKHHYKLIRSASRIDTLEKKPYINIGNPDAQWELYKEASKVKSSDNNFLEILLRASSKIEEIKYYNETENYKGNPKALNLLNNKLRARKNKEIYQEEANIIDEFLKQRPDLQR